MADTYETFASLEQKEYELDPETPYYTRLALGYEPFCVDPADEEAELNEIDWSDDGE
jgi:hypothetical protein